MVQRCGIQGIWGERERKRYMEGGRARGKEIARWIVEHHQSKETNQETWGKMEKIYRCGEHIQAFQGSSSRLDAGGPGAIDNPSK